MHTPLVNNVYKVEYALLDTRKVSSSFSRIISSIFSTVHSDLSPTIEALPVSVSTLKYGAIP